MGGQCCRASEARWLADASIRPAFVQLLKEHGGDPTEPTKDSAAWEACVEPLRQRFSDAQLGFGRMDLYRVVPKNLVADDSDFEFAWQQRKAELLARWRKEAALAEFASPGTNETPERQQARRVFGAKTVSGADFCLLCQELQRWVAEEAASRKRQRKPPVPRHALGLRSAEAYDDPKDAPRIAAIYNGLSGRGRFVAYRKGDPEGSRWIDNEPLYVEWTKASVQWLSTAPEARWQGHKFFLTAGITWTAVANHAPMKARFQDPCIFDADSMRLTPNANVLPPLAFLAVFNSDVLSFFKMKFLKHTQKWEIGDLRQLPLVMPTKAQARRLESLAELAIEAKRAEFAGRQPAHELARRVRLLTEDLALAAPAYLKPSAQQGLLATPADCLAVIECAVSWEAEKLFGIEGGGPPPRLAFSPLALSPFLPLPFSCSPGFPHY